MTSRTTLPSVALFLWLALGCGNSTDDPVVGEAVLATEATGNGAQIVRATDRVFAVEDFEDAGLKHSKDYKTDGLPEAMGVSLFFWQVDGTPVQYEVRFYLSHDEAVSSGMSYAIEGAGPEAIIDPDFARYTEGLRDRRTIVHTRGSPTPRYGDFVIYGNMIALCEGRDTAQGSERCASLIAALDATGG